MKLFSSLTVLTLLGGSPAFADNPALQLVQGGLFTDPVGSMLSVSVSNGMAKTLDFAAVKCSFTADGKPAGVAGTRIYNIVAGSTGESQVHLLGTKADAATCEIVGSSPRT